MDAIMVTKAEFCKAINDEMESVLRNPTDLEETEAKLMFVIGGTIFAQCVMKRLFECNDD